MQQRVSLPRGSLGPKPKPKPKPKQKPRPKPKPKPVLSVGFVLKNFEILGFSVDQFGPVNKLGLTNLIDKTWIDHILDKIIFSFSNYW